MGVSAESKASPTSQGRRSTRLGGPSTRRFSAPPEYTRRGDPPHVPRRGVQSPASRIPPTRGRSGRTHGLSTIHGLGCSVQLHKQNSAVSTKHRPVGTRDGAMSRCICLSGDCMVLSAHLKISSAAARSCGGERRFEGRSMRRKERSESRSHSPISTRCSDLLHAQPRTCWRRVNTGGTA